ncbi:hypothetical protein [Nonomuraea sp. NPDC049504]|uniref:hypothetical protein n=1 Tax=Nonomuraea sp. NPDC049504 TaxID=3154729 RepID=UPI00341AC36E
MDRSGRRRGRHAAGRHAGRSGWRRGLLKRAARGRTAAAAGVVVGGAVVALAVNGMFGAPATYGLLGTIVAPAASPPADGGEPHEGRTGAARPGPRPPGSKGAEAVSRGERRLEPPKPRQQAPSRSSGLVPGVTTPDDVLAEGPAAEDGKDYKADGPSRHTDVLAAEYFRTNWGVKDKAFKRLKDVRTVGGYLRIYTDLPESADNSLTAIKLCERGLAYLHEQGVQNPVVFVHSEFGENGNPVLANILGPSDRSCRVTYPNPR